MDSLQPSKDFLGQLQIVVNIQEHLLKCTNHKLSELEQRVGSLEANKGDIHNLLKQVDELDANIDLLTIGDLSDTNLDTESLKILFAERKRHYERAMQTIGFNGNWAQFVRDCQVYAVQNEIQGIMPWEAFLAEEDFSKLKAENYEAQYRWDQWDYLFVGGAGVIAALTDFLLVCIPKTMTYNGVKQAGSPITAWLKKIIDSTEGNNSWFARWARNLEASCKVPYDAIAGSELGGICGKTHRMQTFGHDPILGFIFGIFDIMRGSITGFSYDHLSGTHTVVSTKITEAGNCGFIEALLLQLGHLVSDVGTSQGLPPPFFTLFQGINVKNPLSPKGRTIGQIARWMYVNGYDLRHFITMGITPASIEIILRAYLMVRHYSEHGEVRFILANNPKYRSMLLSAHAIASAANVGKIALHQGNPLAINYAQYFALLRYLLPSLKYWIFDKQKLKLAYMDEINESGWDQLSVESGKLMGKINLSNMPLLALR
jgi:hypothetical protein